MQTASCELLKVLNLWKELSLTFLMLEIDKCMMYMLMFLTKATICDKLPLIAC